MTSDLAAIKEKNFYYHLETKLQLVQTFICQAVHSTSEAKKINWYRLNSNLYDVTLKHQLDVAIRLC